jgi:hypothetical protein
MEFVFADRIEDVLAAALPGLPRPEPVDGGADGLAGRGAGTLIGSGRAGEARTEGT